jgi:hypothetical protein
MVPEPRFTNKKPRSGQTDFRTAKNGRETLTLTKREWGTLPGSLLAAGVLSPRGKESSPSAASACRTGRRTRSHFARRAHTSGWAPPRGRSTATCSAMGEHARQRGDPWRRRCLSPFWSPWATTSAAGFFSCGAALRMEGRENG